MIFNIKIHFNHYSNSPLNLLYTTHLCSRGYRECDVFYSITYLWAVLDTQTDDVDSALGRPFVCKRRTKEVGMKMAKSEAEWLRARLGDASVATSPVLSVLISRMTTHHIQRHK